MVRYSNGTATRIMGLSTLFQTQKNSRNNLQKNTIFSNRTLDIPYGEDIFDIQFPKCANDHEYN